MLWTGSCDTPPVSLRDDPGKVVLGTEVKLDRMVGDRKQICGDGCSFYPHANLYKQCSLKIRGGQTKQYIQVWGPTGGHEPLTINLQSNLTVKVSYVR